MQKSIIIKGLTLGCFAFLLTAFVMYRSGRLDNFVNNSEQPSLQGSPNGGTVKNVSKADSAKRKKEKPKTRMSGSKSMVMTDEIMPSSKSGQVFTPKPKQDTVKKNTVQPQQKTK